MYIVCKIIHQIYYRCILISIKTMQGFMSEIFLGVCNLPDLVNCEASTTTEEPTDAPTDTPTDATTSSDDNGEETTVFSMDFLF